MPKVSTGELTIAYEIQGSGPPLLMLHGFEGNRHSFNHFIPMLEGRFTVITFDQRDCGDTVGPDREYDSFQHARDAADLLSVLGYEEAYVYGQSNGGVIAQALVMEHPNKVKRLVLAVTTPGRRGVLHPGSSVDAIRGIIDRRPTAPSSPERFFSPGAFERKPHLKEMFAGKSAPRDPERVRRRALALESFDSLDDLGKIHTPTLVIGAREDQLFPPTNSWMIAERIPDARLIVLEKVGHALTWEAPELVASIIAGFFTERSEA